ncbi:WXG100 family type VII secretion target [Kitasatospora sp. NPDC049285]|uniref:WXG100 family type VII secretion target n=1 Tax=Kitasatospora sp. NPDC049285 TaxID=3157096 RepID=UPI0034247FE6
MSDLDINVDHTVVTEATEQMKAYAHQMHSSLEQLMQELMPAVDSFQGAAGTAFQDFKRTVEALDTAMTTEFDSGADRLADMHDTLRSADQRSAQLFG